MEDIWCNFSGCSCLQYILIDTGYDNVASLKCINDNLINELESYVDKNRENILQRLNCKHKDAYINQNRFEFFPGHRALLLDWCQNDMKNISTLTFNEKHPSFTPILKEIIDSALKNYKQSVNRHRYSEILIDFSIYLFIMAGKACYETLSANLHLPKSGTICKSYFFFQI